jgi:uncharacterized protein YdbL (DUF1318 family)
MANFKVTLTQTTPDFTLKKKPAVSNINVSRTTSPQNLTQMEDTVTEAVNKEDGAILVYKKSTSKYVLKKVLTWDDVLNNYKMDGGEF